MSDVHSSVCPLDCPDTCSLAVTVDEGRITQVRGSKANPLTRGVICNKVTRFPDWVHGEGRLTQPMRRTGPKGSNQFAPISWEAALDAIHGNFQRTIAAHGPQAILPLNYAGPHGMLAGGSMDLRFFHKLGASLLNRPAMCGGVRSQAWRGTFGLVPGARPEHIAEAQLIVVWGNNVTFTQLHAVALINEARKQGAKLVVVDPVRIKIAEQADLHIAPLPGTDLQLCWALAAELERLGALDQAFIEAHVQGAEAFLAAARAQSLEDAAQITGVPVEQIQTLARWYAEASPALLVPGNGQERSRNGGAGIRAMYALPALTGKFRVRGGGVVGGAGNSFPKTAARLQRPDFVPPGTRTVNILDVGTLLNDRSLDPPIDALFIYNHNALIVHPDQNAMRRGLARADLFTVVCDVVWTDTVPYADIVLPASSHFEYGDLYAAYGTHWLQRAEAVIPPQHQSLPNTEIFRRLAARFGFTEAAFTATDAELMDDAVDAADPRLRGHRPSALPTSSALDMQQQGKDYQLFGNIFPATPSGKIELESSYLAETFGEPLPRHHVPPNGYPLALVTPASNQRTTSTFGELPASDEAWLEMHPRDAAARGLKETARVKVFNDLGEVHLPLRVTDRVRPGVVCSYKGAWMRTSDNGQTVSALAPTHKADLAEGACYNDTRVDVAAL